LLATVTQVGGQGLHNHDVEADDVDVERRDA
jgi:hypothetical protein